jgi:hypothetical protein
LERFVDASTPAITEAGDRAFCAVLARLIEVFSELRWSSMTSGQYPPRAP